jgi:HEAT repeat protein/ATP/ADP translocase
MFAGWVERFLKVYKEEQASFLLVLVLFLCMRASNIMVENYAETTFLKRYGVEYLPLVFLINSITLFVVINVVGLLLDRMARTSLLRWLLVMLIGLLVFVRLLLPLNISLLYPFLYILVAQSRYMLVVVFWVIGGDLFTYRQTKRLFPPIEAGGALGVILGSAASGLLGSIFSIDNVLLAAGVVLFGGVAATFGIERKLATVLTERPSRARRPLELTKEKSGFGDLIPLIRGSRFLQLIILLVIIPNLLLPIFNFQWSVILDRRFGSEGGLMMFYALFKAISNGINLVILLFVGRAYTRFGVTTILFFHPANYLFLFGGLLGSFTLPMAIYGRISTNILRTSCFRPAMYMIFNFLDPRYRGRLVSFLQGTMGRLGTLVGSAILLVGSPFIDPRLFGLVGCLGAGAWVAGTFGLSRVYTKTLFESLVAGHVDLEALEQVPVRDLLDKPTVERLVEALEEDESTATLAAELLAEKPDPEVARRMVSLVPDRPEAVQVAILDAVGKMGPMGIGTELETLAERLEPQVAARSVAALGKADPVRGEGTLARYLTQGVPVVRAQAAAAVYLAGYETLKDRARQTLMGLLGEGTQERTAAVEAMAATGDASFVEPLMSLLDEADSTVREAAVRALGALEDTTSAGRLLELLHDASPSVRRQSVLALGELYAQAQ